MLKWVFLGGAVVSEVTASLSLKAALDHPAFYAIVVVGFVSAFTFLTLTLKPVSYTHLTLPTKRIV